MDSSTVYILLAAYNGEAFLRQQIDSLLQQDHEDIHIILSDDGSTDATPAILEEYAQRCPNKITHYRSGRRFGNAQNHFLHLTSVFRNKRYIMYCDQDDVWHSDKVSKTLHLMQKTEVSDQTPTLVHTDLRVVDGHLQQIAPSFCAFSGFRGDRLEFNRLLMQNVVTGCTVMINSALAKLLAEAPAQGILMHDWILALMASACGTVAFLDEATIDYRQHGKNAVGANNAQSLRYILTRLKSNVRKPLEDTAHQAGLLLAAYPDAFTPSQREILEAFSSIYQQNKIRRILCYFKYGLWKAGLHRKLAQLLWG